MTATLLSPPAQLSAHFSFAESIRSATATSLGLSNQPEDSVILSNMLHTAQQMEIVRQLLGGKSIHVNSWYRCKEVNSSIGSRDSSDHIRGNAVDFTCESYGSPLKICKLLIQYQDTVRFKQLILEHSWVHISWDTSPNTVPKLQVLSLLNGGTYAIGLTDQNGKYYA